MGPRQTNPRQLIFRVSIPLGPIKILCAMGHVNKIFDRVQNQHKTTSPHRVISKRNPAERMRMRLQNFLHCQRGDPPKVREFGRRTTRRHKADAPEPQDGEPQEINSQGHSIEENVGYHPSRTFRISQRARCTPPLTSASGSGFGRNWPATNEKGMRWSRRKALRALRLSLPRWQVSSRRN